ncbi:uncharacterized protein PFL1_01993 [Pseudozyma flocculosa PF-1]|uniref:uncharacterized protein n=1 Tax=Pseudozyma flocculosa PF-1 TaxID=1277687 RepID=UPI0004561AEE|nr:uncharacterized protein PFL1_01993 [Pseudozyma flocculosa PF-1]EPQ30467.1 hypothetical protein PFL1_01993 [Pseudozyma flocculosa PF-1]
MFYSEVILAKKGPLARVWLAAHMERKLSKTQFLQTSIEKSVSAIMGQEVVPMALRLSGQLLLGVVRIYSRKAKYLLEDCNEALLKIKMAFRSGAVDMTSDQLNISRNAITLQDTRTDLDILLPDPALENWSIDFSRTAAKKAKSRSGTDGGSSHVARAADITLPHVDYTTFDDTFDISSGIDGIASQDFDPDGGLDLGLEDDLPEATTMRRDELGRLVDENGDPIAGGIEDDSLSIGVGRDAPSETGRQSVASMLNLGKDGELQLGSELGGSVRAPSIGLPDFDMGGDGLDLGLDDGGLDLGLDGPEPMDVDAPAPPPDAERPVTPPPGDNSMALAMADMTPTTAARIRDAAAKRQQDEAASKQAKARKQLIDARTELPESQLGGRPALGSLSQGLSQGASQLAGADLDILTEERYLPRSRAYLRLLTIRQDPTAHFLPYADPANKDKSSFFIGPAGLAPELSELFTFDLSAMRRRRAAAAAAAEDEGPSKRARLEGGEDDDKAETDDDEGGVKKLSFAKVSQNASRRAAAGFFFEMLVLGTKDCVKLQQHEEYGDIKVLAKPKLWQTAAGSVRA